MKKIITMIVLVTLSISSVMSADYEYIDRGDYYYIYNFGENDDYVVVVRKLKDSKVKVRNIDTGATQVVYASQLLTKSEVNTRANMNVAVGAGVMLCLFGGCGD